MRTTQLLHVPIILEEMSSNTWASRIRQYLSLISTRHGNRSHLPTPKVCLLRSRHHRMDSKIQARHTLQKGHSLFTVQCGKNLPIIDRPFGRIDTSFLSNPQFLSNNGTNIQNKGHSLLVSLTTPAYIHNKEGIFPSTNLGYHNHSLIARNWHNRKVYSMKIIPILCRAYTSTITLGLRQGDTSILPSKLYAIYGNISPFHTTKKDTHSHRAQCAFHCSSWAFQWTPSRVKSMALPTQWHTCCFCDTHGKQKWGESLGTSNPLSRWLGVSVCMRVWVCSVHVEIQYSRQQN
jgi:hypothetical protein